MPSLYGTGKKSSSSSNNGLSVQHGEGDAESMNRFSDVSGSPVDSPRAGDGTIGGSSSSSSSRNPYSHLLPSCRTIKESLQLIQEAFTDLSILGKVQVALLLANLIATFVIVYAVSSEQHRDTDYISLYYGLEFIIMTTVNIVYTVCVENTFAFYGLIFLELEVVAFVTTSALVGVLSNVEPIARWIIVGLNWSSIVAFLMLQRAVRKSWGWHAYRLAGITATAVKAYREYQQFAALLLLDVFHAIFFITAEEVVRAENTLAERIMTYVSVFLTLLLARVTQMSIRHERATVVWCLFGIYVSGLGVNIYFAIVNTQRAALGQGRVLNDDGDITESGERTLVASMEWCVVVVRIAFLSAIAKVCSGFSGTLPTMFPRRALKTEYLIDSAQVEEARHRAVSTHTTAPRHIRALYDTNAVRVGDRTTTILRNAQTDDGDETIDDLDDSTRLILSERNQFH